MPYLRRRMVASLVNTNTIYTMEKITNDEWFPRCREGLYSAVIGDVMDAMGSVHQFLPPLRGRHVGHVPRDSVVWARQSEGISPPASVTCTPCPMWN